MNAHTKRVTVFCRQEDIELLLQLCILHNGASDSELFRLGLRAMSGDRPAVQISPQLPPLPDLVQLLSKLSNLTRLLEAAARNGWPDHLPGESQLRYDKVELARKHFDHALVQIKPTLHALFALVAVAGGLTNVDVAAVQRAMRVCVEHPSPLIAPRDVECFRDFAVMVGLTAPTMGRHN